MLWRFPLKGCADVGENVRAVVTHHFADAVPQVARKTGVPGVHVARGAHLITNPKGRFGGYLARTRPPFWNESQKCVCAEWGRRLDCALLWATPRDFLASYETRFDRLIDERGEPFLIIRQRQIVLRRQEFYRMAPGINVPLAQPPIRRRMPMTRASHT